MRDTSSVECSAERVLAIQQVAKMFNEFLRESSLHGLKYIGQPTRSWKEKTVWTVIFLSGLGLSLMLSGGIWQIFNSSEIVMSIVTTNQPLSHFNFPAVTVCSHNRISKWKLDQLRSENSQLQALTEKELLLALKILIKPDSGYNRTDELEGIQETLEANGVTINHLINLTQQVMINCKDILVECQWQYTPIPCSEIFSLRPTDQGFCCGFNKIRWGPGGEKIPDDRLETKIFSTVYSAGFKSGLTVLLDTNSEDFSIDTSRSDGFKALIHNPNSYPQVDDLGFSISPGFETFSGVIPNYGRISPAIDRMSKEQRPCRRTVDQVLQFHNKYSMSNCLVECLTLHMLSKCSCRPFFYADNATSRICNLKEHVCLTSAIQDFKTDPFPMRCRCLPRCKGYWYTTEYSIGAFPGHGFLSSRMAARVEQNRMNTSGRFVMSEEYLKKNLAVLNVYYSQPTGNVYLLDIAFKIEQFISSLGGLLGIGVGFSFISLVEIFYFFVFRQFFDKHRHSNVNKVQKIQVVPKETRGK